MGVVMVSVFLAIGTGLAYGLIFLDRSNHEVYHGKIQTLSDGDLQWLYLGLVLFGRTIALLNIVPTGYKKGLKGTSGPIRFSLRLKTAKRESEQWFCIKKTE